MIPADERGRCAVVALKHGIDYRLLIALRETENGGPGREFGVLDEGAQTWDQQAEIAARTIRHTMGRYWAAMQGKLADWWDDQAGRYTADFLHYFSRGGQGYVGYAPMGAANDPQGLNQNHYGNLLRFYGEACGT